jgi:hypothetical protein
MEGLMSLVAATEFAGLKVKEWNIVQFSKLSSLLNDIVKEYKDQGIGFEQFSTLLQGASETGMMEISQSVLNMLSPFAKRAPQLICVSCNVEQSKLDDLSFTDGIVVVLLILKANMEHLNRFFVSLAAKPNSAA